jgi:hypothetical protein
MSDLSKLSDEELTSLYNKAKVKEISKSANQSSGWDALKWLGESALGVATGVGEALNPLAAPRGLEVLGKAIVSESGGPLDRLSQANSKKTFFESGRIDQVAPIGRSLIQKGVEETKELFGGNDARPLVDIYDQEVSAQNKFNETVGETSRNVGEIGAGLLGLAQGGYALAKKAPAAIKTVRGWIGEAPKAIDKLDESAQGLGSVARKGPQKILREMTGPLPEKVEGAIINRTNNVRKILQDPNSETKIYDSVIKMRDNLADTDRLLTGALKEFRTALHSNKETLFDSTPVLEILEDFSKNRTLSGGKSIIDPDEAAMLAKYRDMLSNPVKSGRGVKASNSVTVGDVVKIMDKMDGDLQPLYNRTDMSPKLLRVKEARDALDAGLADIYPNYKEAKVLFKSFKDGSDAIRGKIESSGAESFLANLFGQNKTEMQLAVESTLNQAEEAAKSLQKLNPDFTTGFKAADAAANKAMSKIQTMASEIKAPKAQDFLNDLADKIAARRLKSFSDKDADEVNRLVKAYVQPRANVAQGAGSALFAMIGYKATGSTTAGGVMGYAGGKAARGLAELALNNVAKDRYDND